MEAHQSDRDARQLRPITPREYHSLSRYIREHAGIDLGDGKQALLVGRLTGRLRSLGLASFGDYVRHLEEHGEKERGPLIDCISTNETSFFREPAQFAFLRDEVLPRWGQRAPRLVRAWSAGCSTGEEPYSLAMLLLDRLPPAPGYEIDILATDVSERAVERARDAIWPLTKAREIPEPYVKRFLLRGTGEREGTMRAGPGLRAVVRVEPGNLTRTPYPASPFYDLIFCRNVLIYFDAQTRSSVVDHLLDRLVPGGLLFLGHAESLHGQNARVCSVMPSVYQLRAQPGSPIP